MPPTARDGPRPVTGEWVVFHFGDIVRCPGYNWDTKHACGKGLGHVQQHAEVSVCVNTVRLTEVQLVSRCNRCKTEIAWRTVSLPVPAPRQGAA